MRRFVRAGLAAAGLAAAAGAAEPELPADPPLEVVEAGAVSGTASGEVALEGGMLLRRGGQSFRAPRGTWDPASRTLTASGGALLAQPGRILSADSLRLTLGGLFEARGVHAWMKEGPPSLDLSTCRDATEAERRGPNRVIFSGERLTGRDGEEELSLEGARISLCDCASGPPSWEIRAGRAEIEPGKRALLTWPVLYITPRFLGMERQVPVLALPYGYLPLADRQSGLLIPELHYDKRGFTYGQPVYWALARSWDATATPEWSTGPSDAQRQADRRGVRGPGVSLELRWAPASGNAGEAKVHLVHPTLSDWPGGVWRPPGGDRVAAELRHAQGLGADGALAVEAHLLGDPFQAADFSGDLLQRQADYRRSAAALSWRGPDLLVSGQAELLEAVARVDSGGPYDAGAGPVAVPRAPFGWFGTDLSGLQRLPAAALQLLPVPILGPLRLSGRAELARFAPLRGPGGDEGADGLGPGDRGWGMAALDVARRLPDPAAAPARLPRLADAGERDGRWQDGERLAGNRALVRAELRAPLRTGRFLSAEPWLAASGAGYAFDEARPAQGTVRLAGGLALSSELGRRFGAGEDRLLHLLQPSLEWRFGTRASGPALPSGLAFDEQDLAPAPTAGFRVSPAGLLEPVRALSAAPPGGYQQLRAGLRSRLAGIPGRAALDAEIGQDLDLQAGRRAESFAALTFRTALLALDAGARFYAPGATRPPGSTSISPSDLDRFSELRAAVALGVPAAEVHASFQATGPGGSQRLAAGTDPLFDPRPLGLDPAAQGRVGFRVRWSAATLSYDADFIARALATPAAPGARTGPHVFQHSARAVWDSPCRCFKAGLSFALKDGDRVPSVSLVFDLAVDRAGELASGSPGAARPLPGG